MSRGPKLEGLSLTMQENNQLVEWTRRAIRRGTHRSTVELENVIRDYLATHNKNRKPFKWTKSADDILASLARFCTRTSNSGH